MFKDVESKIKLSLIVMSDYVYVQPEYTGRPLHPISLGGPCLQTRSPLAALVKLPRSSLRLSVVVHVPRERERERERDTRPTCFSGNANRSKAQDGIVKEEKVDEEKEEEGEIWTVVDPKAKREVL